MGLHHEPAPELRARIIGTVLRAVAETPDRILYDTMFIRVLNELEMPEEEVSQAIMCSTSLLVRTGLIECNKHDRERGEITYGQDTVVVASEALLSFVWRESIYAHGPAVDGEGADA